VKVNGLYTRWERKTSKQTSKQAAGTYLSKGRLLLVQLAHLGGVLLQELALLLVHAVEHLLALVLQCLLQLLCPCFVLLLVLLVEYQCIEVGLCLAQTLREVHDGVVRALHECGFFLVEFLLHLFYLELELRLSLDQFLVETCDDIVFHLHLSLEIEDNVMCVFFIA